MLLVLRPSYIHAQHDREAISVSDNEDEEMTVAAMVYAASAMPVLEVRWV
jgi:hypothetical protein